MEGSSPVEVQRMGRYHVVFTLLILSVAALSQCSGWGVAALSKCSGWADIEWENHGNGILNHRSAKAGPDQKISAATVSTLRRRWAFPTGFDVSATPAVADGTVYFPGWNGMLYALNAQTGTLRWQSNLTTVAAAGGGAQLVSRATPVVWKELLLVGLLGPPIVLAVNRTSGCLVWKTARLDPTTYAVITMSGTAHEGYYYVGVSSREEVFTCCTFQGSFLKIDINDGSVVWRTSMLPPNSGYYGAALWGSSPSIDSKRRLVFIATGNNYKVPDSVESCENARLQNNTLSPDTCLDPSNHQDSMLALNMDNGAIVWSRSLQAYDVWTIPCQSSPTTPNCPSILGPDYDFGEAPMIIYLDHSSPYKKTSQNTTCVVVAGQKSGVMWALDCNTGSIIWSTVVGPGGSVGGASWGSCSDGKRVYTNIINSSNMNFTLAPSNESTKGGGWVALDARTGKVIWSVAEPSGEAAYGPLSVSKGVVFGTSYTSSGDVYALDALTGSILWHGTTNAGIYGGASISRSCIFVGNGYHNIPLSTLYNGTAFTAFCLP